MKTYILNIFTFFLTPMLCIAATNKPNVLFIIADDLNCYLGVYGNQYVKSPNIDKLATRGTVFTKATCQFPVCGPSRSSFMSGLRPNTLGITSNGPSLYKTQPGIKSIPSVFKQHGYITARAGKIFNHHDNNEKRDWDAFLDGPLTKEGQQRSQTGQGETVDAGHIHWDSRWRAAECEDSDLSDGTNTDSVIKWMTEKKEKPFFLAMGFLKPHQPLISPKKYYDLYNKEQLHQSWKKYDKEKVPLMARNTAGTKLEAAINESQRVNYNLAYYAAVSYIDAQVGKLIQALEENDLADNTIIVLFGDNGFHLGEHKSWGKNMLFEPASRVPLIIVDPSSKTVPRYDHTVELIDLFPTLLDMCNLPPIDQLEGSSLVSSLKGVSKNKSHMGFTQVEAYQGWSIRTDRWRLINADPATNSLLLYDLENDPGELQNQADNPERKALINKLSEKARAMGFNTK
ncbi:MAG: sulfatase [Lentisphaeraceae bacterium]|nr:sulfatase [Lentisphaeraceae bacterium]